MPKLTKKAAERVSEAEIQEGGFEPVKPGWYPMELAEVTVSDEKGKSGYHYWKVQFKHVDKASGNKRQFTNLSLSPKADFKMKEFFAAFEVPEDTDTDELLGTPIMGRVTVTTIQDGDRKGDKTNSLENFRPMTEADEAKLNAEDDGEEEEGEEEPF